MKNVNDKIKVYLITGVAGFIGANLAKRILNLKNEKIHIIGIDNLNDYYDVKLKEYRLSELQKFDKLYHIITFFASKNYKNILFLQKRPDYTYYVSRRSNVKGKQKMSL